jgi:hypothetical protein
MPNSPDYTAIAQNAIELYRTYAAGNPSARATSAASEPSSPAGLPPLHFDTPTPRGDDRYLLGNFVEGTWVSKLESDVRGEEGLYNFAVSLAARTSPISPRRGRGAWSSE